MLELLQAGGWVMAPLLLCSILALAIVFERGWALRAAVVLPPELPAQLRAWLRREGALDAGRLAQLRGSSPLGAVYAAGLAPPARAPAERRAAIEDAGRAAALELERHLAALGTVAMVAPLLGLLGTVWGLIVVFERLAGAGVGAPADLAGGIGQALITTAAGLAVAIPALVCHRHFLRRARVLTARLEAEARRLVEMLDARGGAAG